MSADLLRPYADLDDIFEAVDYRPSLNVPFEPLDIDGQVARKTVIVDDLRTIPQHEFRVKLEMSKLKPHYSLHKQSLRLAVIVRDTTLRREILLNEYTLDAVPETIALSRERLRLTALRDVMAIDFVVLTSDVLKGSKALPTQKASRLAELQIVLRNNAGGASFPYKRASAQELKDKGLPNEAALHLEMICDPVELLKETDTPLRNLFEILVHEKVWSAIQSDHWPASSGLRTSAITIDSANLLLAAIIPLLKNDQEIHVDSPIGQLLSFVEKQASLRDGQLRRQFQADGSLHALAPYLQNAFRFVTLASRFEEEMPE